MTEVSDKAQELMNMLMGVAEQAKAKRGKGFAILTEFDKHHNPAGIVITDEVLTAIDELNATGQVEVMISGGERDRVIQIRDYVA